MIARNGQLVLYVACTFLIAAIPCTLFSQDRYPSLFDEMSSVEPAGRSIYFQASVQSNAQSETSGDVGSLAATPDTQPSTAGASGYVPPPPETDPPKVHGQSLLTHQFDFQNSAYNTNGYAEYVVPGRLRIADDNSAETDNRFIFRQSHFHNGIDNSLTNAIGTQYYNSDNVDQFVVGFEKTMGRSECWSVEMRLPLFGTQDAIFADGFSTQNASVGNLAMIGKRILHRDECRTVSAGLGLSVPTGDDASFIAGDEVFTVRNRATHLAPFIATLWKPNAKWFFHGFLSADVAAASNPIEYRQLMPGGNSGGFGSLTNQTLLSSDLVAGYWWFRDRECRTVTAVSSMLELHSVTAFSDGDMVSGNTATNSVQFRNPLGSFQTLNVTAGLDIELNNRFHVRTAAVLPIRDSDNRFFDAEIQASFSFRH